MTSSHSELTSSQLLTSAVESVFKNWEAFQIGTSIGKHSNEIGKWIIQVTEQCLKENSDVDDGIELGEWIGEILDNEFNLRVEDGSLTLVGYQLISYWNLYKNNQLAELAQILDNIKPSTQILPPKLQVEDSSDEDEGMDTNDPNENPSTSASSKTNEQSHSSTQPDPEGWILVKKGKKH